MNSCHIWNDMMVQHLNNALLVLRAPKCGNTITPAPPAWTVHTRQDGPMPSIRRRWASISVLVTSRSFCLTKWTNLRRHGTSLITLCATTSQDWSSTALTGSLNEWPPATWTHAGSFPARCPPTIQEASGCCEWRNPCNVLLEGQRDLHRFLNFFTTDSTSSVWTVDLRPFRLFTTTERNRILTAEEWPRCCIHSW